MRDPVQYLKWAVVVISVVIGVLFLVRLATGTL
ncbi:MAG: hypothetical protein RI885_1401 [Actinomycetota bacterium]|jgi:hypothetical protein